MVDTQKENEIIQICEAESLQNAKHVNKILHCISKRERVYMHEFTFLGLQIIFKDMTNIFVVLQTMNILKLNLH